MKSTCLPVLILPLLLISACVSSGKHEAALAEIENMRQSLQNAEREIDTRGQKIETTEQELENSRKRNALAQQEIEQSQQQLMQTAQELESARAQIVTATNDLMLIDEKKQALQNELAQSQAQLETLRQIENETNRRNQIYKNFVERLKTMIDGGQLTVSIEQGRIVINLPDNVLFNSGSASLNPEGRKTLTEIADVLGQFTDRNFQIEGHTDNKPISSERFPSNWELSAARAITVVHLLTDMGVAPGNISAAGFGEFRPRAENETDAGRKLNRRIEIIMQPNLDILSNELPRVAG